MDLVRECLNISYAPFIIFYCWQNLFALIVSTLLYHYVMLLLILLIMKILLKFLLKLNSHRPCTSTSSLQRTMKQNHRTSHNCNVAKNILKLMAFKIFLNHLFLEIECLEVKLICWSLSFQFIRSFLKFLFVISLVKWFLF